MIEILIYNESSYVSGPVYKNDWITSKTALAREDYGDAPRNFVKRLGVPTAEWDRVGSVYVLRVCLLNPFISHNVHFDVLWDGLLAILKEKLAAAIAGDAKC